MPETTETPSGVTPASMDEINAWYKSAYADLQAEHGEYPPLTPVLALGDQYRHRIIAARKSLFDEMTAEQRAERVAEQAASMAALAQQKEAERVQRMGTAADVQTALDAFTGHAPAGDPRVGKW